tara:strand:- start:3648 stop:4343 length:696 start_codon:yes stop_codon:yes gene_type:complete
MTNFVHHLVHNLIALAFLPPPSSVKHTTIDHIDHNPDNNCASNLRWATRSEQKVNQRLVKKVQRTARAVIVTNGDNEERFVSMKQAADTLGMHRARCAGAAKDGKRINGYIIKYDDGNDVDIAGEEWKVAPGDDTLRVSNQGRLQRFNKVSKMWAQKIMPDGNPRCGGYCMVKVSGKAWSVHRLVATLFLDPPDDPLRCTVDHINRIRTDNRVSNLRWATMSEQRINRVRN